MRHNLVAIVLVRPVPLTFRWLGCSPGTLYLFHLSAQRSVRLLSSIAHTIAHPERARLFAEVLVPSVAVLRVTVVSFVN